MRFQPRVRPLGTAKGLHTTLETQWNLFIKETSGLLEVSFKWRCPLFKGHLIHKSMYWDQDMKECPLSDVLL